MSESVQLQFFNSATQAYVPESCFEKPDTAACERLADIGRASGRSWRLARVIRPLKPARATKARLTCGYRLSIADMQREYLAWAQAKGLKSIHVYSDKPLADRPERKIGTKYGPSIYRGTMLQITLEEHMHVTHTIDTPTYRPEVHAQICA